MNKINGAERLTVLGPRHKRQKQRSRRFHRRSGAERFVESMNLGFKSKLMRSLFAQIRCAVESYVESCVESSVELRCKRRFEHVKVVPLSRYSDGLRALFRDDRVVMQPTMTIFLLSLLSLLFLLSFLSSSSLFGLKLPFQTTPFLSYHM